MFPDNTISMVYKYYHEQRLVIILLLLPLRHQNPSTNPWQICLVNEFTQMLHQEAVILGCQFKNSQTTLILDIVLSIKK
jgi:hypothetical protein